MSTEKQYGNNKNTIGWQRLIDETRKRIERLQLAIDVFEENIRTGFPFEGEVPAESSSKKATQANA